MGGGRGRNPEPSQARCSPVVEAPASLRAVLEDVFVPGVGRTLGRLAAAPWVAMALFGTGLAVVGAAATGLAATRVVLPYDEAFVGLGRDGLASVDARLLPFLAHDRVSFGATATSLGVLYATLAVMGEATGAAWARRTVLASAAVGFASFFLFLAFGYLDPLHLATWLCLFPLFLLGARRWTPRHGAHTPSVALDGPRDAAWRRARVGRAALGLVGIGLAGAGLTLAAIGSTRVFVPTDLTFMAISPATLAQASPHLLPLIAHDRAGFGGALVAEGVAVLLVARWGFVRGARWVWWLVAVSGGIGFAGAIGVHWAVGYTDLTHLAPAYAGLALFLLALALSRRYLCGARAPDAAPAGGTPRTPRA